eukprot:6490922-Amphidinium_carterae.1
MGNTLQTRWKDKATESTISGKRLHAEGQHRRDLRSDSSSRYVENLADIGTTQEPQHLHACQTCNQHFSTRHYNREPQYLSNHHHNAKYRLRDSPQKFQLHLSVLSSIPKQLGPQQLRSNQCVYQDDDITVMVYVDGLLLIGDDDKIKTFRQKMESQLQLKHITKLQRDQPLVLEILLGRQIEYYNDHIALSMTKEYYTSLLSLYNIKENTNSLSTTGNPT